MEILSAFYYMLAAYAHITNDYYVEHKTMKAIVPTFFNDNITNRIVINCIIGHHFLVR